LNSGIHHAVFVKNPANLVDSLYLLVLSMWSIISVKAALSAVALAQSRDLPNQHTSHRILFRVSQLH
jgi:hypothetical protein